MTRLLTDLEITDFNRTLHATRNHFTRPEGRNTTRIFYVTRPGLRWTSVRPALCLMRFDASHAMPRFETMHVYECSFSHASCEDAMWLSRAYVNPIAMEIQSRSQIGPSEDVFARHIPSPRPNLESLKSQSQSIRCWF